jgi:SAM-dependent methyltransferase
MISKPKRFSPENAEAFKDAGVALSYQHRPLYPDEVFAILAGLVSRDHPRILDVGCGTGNMARYLVGHSLQVDAVDFSLEMIERGRTLPRGDDPHLRWLCGPIEELADSQLTPPYGLVTAGESLHWMDWNVVLPRFRRLLAEGAYLAIVEQRITPDPWSTLGDLVARYRTDGGYSPYDMVEELQRHGLFKRVGTRTSAPVTFVQSIEDFIASYHSRSGFSRERMGAAQAEAFDGEAREVLSRLFAGNTIPFQVAATLVWGLPAG